MKDYKKNLDQIIDCLRRGGVVVFPTETVYALACDITNQNAVNKLYKIKQRSLDKPFAVLMSSIEMADEYVDISESARVFICKYSPGPMSYVLPLKGGVKIVDSMTKNKTLAIRVPLHDVALDILNAYGKPLVGTSVNLSSEKSAARIDEISDVMKQKIDFIFEGDDSGVSGVSSTLVDLCSNDIKILRQGEIKIK